MYGDENARDVARRLVQEVVSRAEGTLPPAAESPQKRPVVTDAGPVPADHGPPPVDAGPPPRPTEAQWIAHRIVLEALSAETETGEMVTERAGRARGAGILARPTVGGTPAPATPPKPEPAPDPDSQPQPQPQPQPAPVPEAEPAPATVREGALPPSMSEPPHQGPAGPAMPIVSAASAEAARRIVAAAIAERKAPDEPGPPPLPASVREVALTPVADPSDEPDGPAWPIASVNLISADPPAAVPAATAPPAADPLQGAMEETDTESLPAVPPVAAQAWLPYLAAAGPPPVFTTLGEPGTGRSLLDQPVDQPIRDVPEELAAGQVPATHRLTPLDRWRARRHRKRLAAQWAPGATPQPRRTWRWVLATVIVAVALGILFPLTVAAFRALVAL